MKKKSKKPSVPKHLKAIQYLAETEERETQLMIQSSLAIHRQNAIVGNFMYWIEAKDELPTTMINVYMKVTFRKRIIMTVGFYSSERKKFLSKSGDWYMTKNVKWLKNDNY